VRQHRSFAPWGKARPEKWRAEPRPEPDSGNPTVRDRRGASGNAASWSLISTRRARLISISTTACTVRCGGGRQPQPVGPARAVRPRQPPADPTHRTLDAGHETCAMRDEEQYHGRPRDAWNRRNAGARDANAPMMKARVPVSARIAGSSADGRGACTPTGMPLRKLCRS
jgi:hypothetical protein